MWSHQEILQVFSINLNQWSEKFGVKRIGLFGSYTRNEQMETSDIDVIVEFSEDCLSFDNYMDLKFILEDIFKKQIDLVISDDIKPAIKQKILRSVKYAEGA